MMLGHASPQDDHAGFTGAGFHGKVIYQAHVLYDVTPVRVKQRVASVCARVCICVCIFASVFACECLCMFANVCAADTERGGA
jgi:hypothetical protein